MFIDGRNSVSCNCCKDRSSEVNEHEASNIFSSKKGTETTLRVYESTM